jgi:hypothetical protein
VGLFLLSIAPITNADSLGYHMTVGKIINEIGTFPKDFTHFHQRLSGSGETLIAIGLAVAYDIILLAQLIYIYIYTYTYTHMVLIALPSLFIYSLLY